jgi:Ca-activated chloride channel family protein
MRVHTVASIALAGMGVTSALVWMLAPANADTRAQLRADRAPPAAEDTAASDPSHFTAGATLTLEGRVGHPRVAADVDQSTFVLATVTGANDARASAVPLDLTIVMDTSGSMRGARLTNAIEAARGMVRRMRDQDSVTVITYSGDAELLVPPTRIDGFSRDRVISTLANVTSMGDTCISCGLEMAMLNTRTSSDRVSRILLLSDGEATSGVRDESGFVVLGQRAQRMGTTVTTIGVDVEYNERVMGTLARFSNGRHYFVESPMGLPPVFDQELESVSRTVANNVELVVDLADGVVIDRVFDRDARIEGSRLVVPFGIVAPGEQKTFLVGVRLPRTNAPERPVASMQLRYTDLVRNAPGLCEGALAARTTTVASEVSELDSFVAARLSRSQTIEAFREANELSRLGQIDAARDRLNRRAREVNIEAGEAARRAPRPVAGAIRQDFEMQSRALHDGSAGFGRPSAAPSVARRNEADIMNPFSQ